MGGRSINLPRGGTLVVRSFMRLPGGVEGTEGRRIPLRPGLHSPSEDFYGSKAWHRRYLSIEEVSRAFRVWVEDADGKIVYWIKDVEVRWER